MRQGDQQDDNCHNHERLLHHILVLLEHLERQSDNRLQAQFDDTRSKLGVSSPKVAIPPCENYDAFFARLARIRKTFAIPLAPKDEQFLRWSRDFLAVVAHPATVETILITRAYIKDRTDPPLGRWLKWRPRRESARVHQTGVAIEVAGFKASARVLARTVRWMERFVVAAIIIALFFSTHAMIGRLIITQEKDALAKFQELTKSADANRIALLRGTGTDALIRPTFSDRGCPAGYQDIAEMEPNRDGTVPIPTTGSQTIAGSSRVADFSIAAAQEAAWSLVTECRSIQWAVRQLMTENIKLNSWNMFYIKDLTILTGWDDPTAPQIRSALGKDSCVETAEPGVSCKKILPLLVRDSTGVAKSRLGWLTMYILPCLYAFIGAVAAAMIGLRRKTDASLLAYSDRGRVRQVMILGFVFGGVIGLFAGYLSKPIESDGLGLSAVALLAGYNIPAVSDMLEDLSKRIFRPGERDAQVARPA